MLCLIQVGEFLERTEKVEPRVRTTRRAQEQLSGSPV